MNLRIRDQDFYVLKRWTGESLQGNKATRIYQWLLSFYQ
ncbi:hypothetical protein SAMN05421677_107102 [Halobacillus aidingensis]|uniref:Uncharacterized protein n=1 Tax=Halobacillus aidingensis TaxID=240303 RepID=A0A1H0LRK3_HALAD|nr:hypothetical protein SAMN05421677_107102 [Halobacillus aidingensis]